MSDVDDLNNVDDKITLMSLHASKGLEFDTVYLTGMNEGIFPSYQSIVSDDKSEIEEERRLCYVGITRAKKKLYLSSTNRRLHNGVYNTYPISRFVDEIDDSLIIKNIEPKLKVRFDDFATNVSEEKNKYQNSYRYKKNNLINDTLSKVDLKKSIDTYKLGANIVKESKLDYTIGDIVNHIKFGNGKVINIIDIGRDYEVTVEFDDFGQKTLFAAFAYSRVTRSATPPAP